MNERIYKELTMREAADLLGVTYAAVASAVKRGILTQMPFSEQRSVFVSEAQVLLFKGKEFSLNSLNRDERKEWAMINEAILHPKEEDREGVPQGTLFRVLASVH